jgi:hypothetical protein
MIEDFHAGRRGSWLVSEDDVETVRGELGQKIDELALAADDPESLLDFKNGAQNLRCGELWDSVGDSDVDGGEPLAGALAYGAE